MKKIIAFLPYAIEYESTAAAVAHIFMQQLFFRKCHALQKKEIESGMIFFILLFWWDIEDLVFFSLLGRVLDVIRIYFKNQLKTLQCCYSYKIITLNNILTNSWEKFHELQFLCEFQNIVNFKKRLSNPSQNLIIFKIILIKFWQKMRNKKIHRDAGFDNKCP